MSPFFRFRNSLISFLSESLFLTYKKRTKNVPKTYQKRTKNTILVNFFWANRSFFVSSKNVWFAHLSWATWATWAICSQLLIGPEQTERIAHSRSLDLSDLSEWANKRCANEQVPNFGGWCLEVVHFSVACTVVENRFTYYLSIHVPKTFVKQRKI